MSQRDMCPVIKDMYYVLITMCFDYKMVSLQFVPGHKGQLAPRCRALGIMVNGNRMLSTRLG